MKKIKTSIGLLLTVAMFLINIPLTRAASVTWTQTDWSGGSGQAAWSDTTMYDTAGGDGVYDTTANQLRMKISAQTVVGQSNFTTGTSQNTTVSGVSAYGLNNPAASIVVGSKLIVTDGANNRVLIYNTIPISNATPADVVIGQTSMSGGSANQSGSVAANTLNGPKGLYSNGTKLFIADSSNNRVLIYNTIPVSDGASADVVVGQANMTSGSANRGGSVAANTLYYPAGVSSDGTKLYIADLSNNRVLIYNTIPVSDGVSADVVVGQVDLAHGSSGTTASTISAPYGVYSDGTKLFISDYSNSRVLIYNTIPTSNNASADVVVGQPTFTSGTANNTFTFSSANSLYGPYGSTVINNKLIVPDYYNNRVLIYNTIPITNNALADVVIGQADFTHNSSNQSGSVAANTLSSPFGVYSDGTKLFISDLSNNRVLIYNTIPISNNVSADVVIGQADFTHNSSGATATTFTSPEGIFVLGTKLFIVDKNNNRVLIYNTIPTSNGASADVVIGQADFTHNAVNQGLGSNPIASTLYGPSFIYSDGTKLYIADADNNRVLIYNTIPVANNALADVVIGQADFTHCTANRSVLAGRGTCGFSSLLAPSANTLYSPFGVYSDGTKLFISDFSNYRVLVYNTIPTSNNASADAVIGQADFTHRLVNQGGAAAANTLGGVAMAFSDGTNFYVSDVSNTRLLIFSGSHSSTLTSSTYDAGTPYTWGPLTYTATTPENTALSFEVSTDDGSTWEAVTNNTTQTFGPSNTVAYRATLSNTDGISTPTLTNVSISGNLVPTVTTAPATSITRTGVTLNGEITATGGTDATERGFKYGLDTNYEDNVFEAPGSYSTGTFTTDLSALHCGKTYHAQAYATNIAGTSYGGDVTFTIPSCLWASGGGGGGTAPIIFVPSPVVPPSSPSSCLPGDAYSNATGLPCSSFTEVPTPSTCLIQNTLRQGSVGEEVKCLQTKLNANLVIDGMFGPLTKASVIHFQLTNKLVGDGIVGPITREVLNR